MNLWYEEFTHLDLHLPTRLQKVFPSSGISHGDKQPMHCYQKNTAQFGGPRITPSSMPYVGMALEKIAATLKVHKWHAQNACAGLVNGLYEPYQSFSAAFMNNRTS